MLLTHEKTGRTVRSVKLQLPIQETFSLVIATCIAFSMISCVCPQGPADLGSWAAAPIDHSCCAGDSGDRATHPHGDSKNGGMDCQHCGGSHFIAAQEVTAPVAKNISPAADLLLGSTYMASTTMSCHRPERPEMIERAASPPDVSVLHQTCILLI